VAYLLIVTGALLGFGKLGDLKGYKNVFIAGLAVFGAGTFLCALAPSLNALLIFRMVQSSGEAMLSPLVVAMLTTFLPEERRGFALGIVALAQGSGFALGNVVGGLINAHFVWRAVFLVNIPIALATMLFSFRIIPSVQPKSEEKSFDIAGAVLIFITLAALLLGLNLMGRKGVDRSVILISFIVSAATFTLFILQERRAAFPLLDLGLFKDIGFTCSNLAAFFVVFIMMGFSFLAPFYLELAQRLDVARAGMLLMTPPFVMLVLSPAAGKVSDLIGSRLLCSAGAAMLAVSCLLFILLKEGSALTHVGAALAALGVAAGIFMAPNNKLVMAHAPSDKQGVASGVYKIGISTGSVFGIAVLPLVIMHTVASVAGREHVLLSEARNYPSIIHAGFHSAFLFCMFMALAAFIFSVLAKNAPKRDDTG
jgi:EmrB/QacA subfamily drug resistance transporter